MPTRKENINFIVGHYSKKIEQKESRDDIIDNILDEFTDEEEDFVKEDEEVKVDEEMPEETKDDPNDTFEFLTKEHITYTIKLAIAAFQGKKDDADEAVKKLLENKERWLDLLDDIIEDDNEAEKIVDEWDSIFWGTSQQPGHTLLAAQIIDLLGKGETKKALDITDNVLVAKNLPLLIGFWQRLYDSLNAEGEDAIFKEEPKEKSEIKKWWTEHLVCTKDYLVILFTKGLKQSFKKSYNECRKKGVELGKVLDSFTL